MDLQYAFFTIDQEKTGKITLDGWMYIMRKEFLMQFSPHDMQELFEYYDKSRTGVIKYGEFLRDIYFREDLFADIRD